MANTSVESVEKELLGLEKRYWQAMKDRDVETAMQLTHFPCLVAGPQGIARVEKDAFAKMMESPTYSIEKVDVGKKVEVKLLGDDVAVVAYTVHEELIIDGKKVSLDAADSSTWLRRDGQWVCALHTESIVGDPFGRDRRSPEDSTRGRKQEQTQQHS